MNIKKKILIVALVLLLALVLYALISIITVNLALNAKASKIDRSPDEFGLAYKNIEFAPRGESSVRLKGWWIPSKNSKATIIGIHSLNGNREDFLEIAPLIVSDGFSLLLFDLRGSGQSDSARTGAGLSEINDVRGAVDLARSLKPAESSKIFLHGISYGAAAALMAGYQEDSVAGVFSDSAFSSLPDLMINEVADRTYLPLWGAALFKQGLTLSARIIKNIDIDTVLPAEAAKEYEYPLGLAHCKADQRVEITHLARIRANVQEPPWLVAYTNCKHANARYNHQEHYTASVLNYFNSRLESRNTTDE